MSTVETEHVLVVPTQLLHELGYFQGFTRDVDCYLPMLLDPAVTSYQPRARMEEDPSFKQLIPYVIFQYTGRSGDGPERVELFQYQRGTGQGERRLHRKRSIGVGGHISSQDRDHFDPYQEGMRRELAEEVEILAGYRSRCVGLINDDRTEVGRVHLGVVHLFEVASPFIEPREDEMLDARFRPLDELLAASGDMESWSQICLAALFAQQ